MFQMPVESDPGCSFQVNLVGQPGLEGEGFEQGGHTAFTVTVKISDRIRAVVTYRRAEGECETVADKKNVSRAGSAGTQERGESRRQPPWTSRFGAFHRSYGGT